MTCRKSNRARQLAHDIGISLVDAEAILDRLGVEAVIAQVEHETHRTHVESCELCHAFFRNVGTP